MNCCLQFYKFYIEYIHNNFWNKKYKSYYNSDINQEDEIESLIELNPINHPFDNDTEILIHN